LVNARSNLPSGENAEVTDAAIEDVVKETPQITVRRTSNDAFRILRVATNATLTIDNLTLRNGFASGEVLERSGGAINNNGYLTLYNSNEASPQTDEACLDFEQ
jgi:hypothetical protein